MTEQKDCLPDQAFRNSLKNVTLDFVSKMISPVVVTQGR